MDKAAALQELKKELAARRDLPLMESNLVFGEGDPDCAVMFIGEAPGQNEDRLRRPFVGRGGQLLDDVIRGLGWQRSQVYISNIVKRRPPENRDPSPDEIAAYRPYLAREIEIVAPKVIATLGRFSMNYFLPDAKITRDHGRVFKIDGRLIFPVYHPAAALRSSEMMAVFREDIKKLPKVLAGELTVEIPAAIANLPEAMAKPKPPKGQKPNQPGLF
ncbi:MAG TPA: uracil-DNA glycosylase [Candidatus Paceibacterota bacterium]|nr:uracil-DNA glycosylase [Candidatus Paceibacterota bacterium]